MPVFDSSGMYPVSEGFGVAHDTAKGLYSLAKAKNAIDAGTAVAATGGNFGALVGFDPVTMIMGYLFSSMLGKIFGGVDYPSFDELPPEKQAEILHDEYNRLMSESMEDTYRNDGTDGEGDSEGSFYNSPEMMADFYERIAGLSADTEVGKQIMADINADFEGMWGESIEEFGSLDNELTGPQDDLVAGDITGDSDMFYDAVAEAEANKVDLSEDDVMDILTRIGGGADPVEVFNEYGVYVDPNGVDTGTWSDAGGSIADRVNILSGDPGGGGGGSQTPSDAAGGDSGDPGTDGIPGENDAQGGSDGPSEDLDRVAVYNNGEWVFSDGTRVPADSGPYNNGDQYSVFQKQDGTWQGEHQNVDPTDTPDVIVTPTPGGGDDGTIDGGSGGTGSTDNGGTGSDSSTGDIDPGNQDGTGDPGTGTGDQGPGGGTGNGDNTGGGDGDSTGDSTGDGDGDDLGDGIGVGMGLFSGPRVRDVMQYNPVQYRLNDVGMMGLTRNRRRQR
jgi:hypothetical protein